MFIIFSSCLVTIVCCSPFDKTSRNNKKESYQFIADNHLKPLWWANSFDKKQPFYLVTYTDDYFMLFGSAKTKTKSQRYYSGHYTYSADTILMSFDKNYRPPEMATYLLRNSSKQTLIYPYSDNVRQLNMTIEYPRTK